MICIQLSGGLGNQLFQYAFGRSLSHDLDTELYVDISHYNWPRQDEIKHVVYGLQAYNIKGIVGNYPYSKYVQENGVNRYHERIFRETTDFPDDSYLDNLDKIELPAYFQGFWNSKLCPNYKTFISEKYFVHNQDIIKEDLQYQGKISSTNQEIIDDMNNYDSIAVHFRRGEYQEFSEFGTCSVEYYMNAISKLKNKLKNPKLYLFTEDHEWVDENLSFDIPVTHVEYQEEKDSSARGYGDLLNTMVQCDHFVIANSTFSWWAAWLSENENKQIYYPNPWFQSQRMLGIDSINNRTDNVIPIDCNYAEFFNKSKNTLYTLNGTNYIQGIKEVRDIDLYPDGDNLVIEGLDKNSRILLEDITKTDEDDAVVIKLSFKPESTGILKLNFLTKESPVYTDENKLIYYYYEDTPFETYIILPNTVELYDLELVPSNTDYSKFTIDSFEIREIENINEFYSP